MLHLYSGQQRDCSKQDFLRHFSKGPNVNRALSATTSSAAPQGDGLGIAVQTFPLQDQCSSVPESKRQRSCPLLHALLTTSSEDTNDNIELNTSTNFSDERHCKIKQVRNVLAALNCGQTRTQNLDHSGGTLSTPHQQPVSSPALSGQPSTNKVSTFREMEPLTDDQILDFIAKRIVYFRTILTQKNGYYGHTHTKELKFWTNDRDFTLQSDGIMPKSNSVAHLPTTPASVKNDVERQGLSYAVIEQCTAAGGQALEEDGSKGSKPNAELTLKSKETEYPQIMMKVAATCTKNEDESPVVLAAVSEVTLDELTEKHPSLTFNCSSSQEEYKSLSLNMNNYLDDTDQVPGVSWFLNNMAEEEKGDTGLIPVEAVGLDNVQGVTDVSENLKTKSSSMVSENKTFELASLCENQDANTKNIEDQQYCGVTCKEVIARSKLNSSLDKIQIHNVVSVLTNQSERLCNQTSCEDVRKGARYVPSQTDLSIALFNKVKEEATLSENKDAEAHSLKFLKDPLYEDISDDEDISQLAQNLPNTEHEELSFPACFEDPLYEDISDDENPQIENMSGERPSTQVPECNNKQSPFENEGYGHVQGQVQVKTETVSDEELIPKKQVSPKTETLDTAQQTDVDFETDDQMDDEWMVMPISMSDLKFEPEYEDQDGPENVLLDDSETGDKCDTPTHRELHWPALKPVLASASSQIEVFDTVESFLHKFNLEAASCRSPPEHAMDSEGEPHTPQNRIESYFEPEDSCETEDSCDYSSGSEHNYLTVSRQLLKRSAPLPPERDSVSEEEGEDVTNVQMGKARSLDKLGCVQKRLIEAKAGSKHVQPKTKRQKLSEMDDIIILDSDTEDDYDQNCKRKANGKRLFSSGSEDSGDAPYVQQKRHSPETVDNQYGAAKEKLQETRLSFADSSLPQHLSELHDTQYKEVMQDACSDLSHSIKSVHLIKAKGGSEQVQHKTNRRTTSKRRVGFHDSDKVVKKDNVSKKKANTKNILSAGSELSGDSSFATQNRPTETMDHLCGTVNEKSEKNRLSGESSDDKQPQSVDKEADSTLSPNPVILRLVQKSTQQDDYLKLLKESQVHMQDKDETWAPNTPTATRKKTDSCEKDMRHLYRNKKGRFVSKQIPANDRHHATKNKGQANVIKPRLVSRQRSLPSQEGPSTSISSLSSTSGKLSEARQSSASSRGLSQSGETSAFSSLPKSKQSTSIPRQHLSSSKLQRSHSYSNPSTFDHPNTPTKGPSSSATMQPSTRKQVIKDWQNSYFPTRRDRKTCLGMDEDFRTTNHNLGRESRPGPTHYDRAPRKRHNSHESATPLMKKTKNDAIQWTKAINRDAPREQRCSVGEGYKWSQKPTMAKPTKGRREGKKCRSPASPHL